MEHFYRGENNKRRVIRPQRGRDKGQDGMVQGMKQETGKRSKSTKASKKEKPKYKKKI